MYLNLKVKIKLSRTGSDCETMKCKWVPLHTPPATQESRDKQGWKSNTHKSNSGALQAYSQGLFKCKDLSLFRWIRLLSLTTVTSPAYQFREIGLYHRARNPTHQFGKQAAASQRKLSPLNPNRENKVVFYFIFLSPWFVPKLKRVRAALWHYVNHRFTSFREISPQKVNSVLSSWNQPLQQPTQRTRQGSCCLGETCNSTETQQMGHLPFSLLPSLPGFLFVSFTMSAAKWTRQQRFCS